MSFALGANDIRVSREVALDLHVYSQPRQICADD